MNRFVRPILFAFEPDLVFAYLRCVWGAAGAFTLDTNHSKGICNFTKNVISFTGTTSASVTVTGVSSFAGLYNGMTVSDGGTHVPANTTISAMNPGAGTITLSQAATGTNTGLTATGGQYTVQFGSQAGVRLDVYVRLLGMKFIFNEISLQGGVSTGASAPAASTLFLVGNNISTRTIPPTPAANLTDATLQLQFGNGGGSSFVAADPANGEIVHVGFEFTRSTAI